FWQTATVNTLDNGEQEITATVDGHVKTITIASVRKYLQLAYAGGLSSLSNTEIFDQLSLMGVGPEVTTADTELNTASTFVSTDSPQRHADTTADDLTLAETLMEIKKSAAKAKGKAKMDETKSPRKMKQREQVQISRDAEVAQKLQEEFDASESVRPPKCGIYSGHGSWGYHVIIQDSR
ncbi:hypothetical protein Tco_0220200, partial [Tanacetum coccineum]